MHASGVSEITEEFYWDCMANGLDPEIIWESLNQGVPSGYLEEESSDFCEKQTEQFRKEVLDDLDYRGVKYHEGFLVLTDTQNSDTHSTVVQNALINSIK